MSFYMDKCDLLTPLFLILRPFTPLLCIDCEVYSVFLLVPIQPMPINIAYNALTIN